MNDQNSISESSVHVDIPQIVEWSQNTHRQYAVGTDQIEVPVEHERPVHAPTCLNI